MNDREEGLEPCTQDGLIHKLAEARRCHRLTPGIRERCEAAAREVLAFLFPHFAPVGAGMPHSEESAIRADLASLKGVLHRALAQVPQDDGRDWAGPDDVEDVVQRLIECLPRLHVLMLEDAEALLAGDPAARTVDEVIIAYPGFRAVALYRVAHALWNFGVPLAPRLITELAHRETGVDIHPGARIGRSFAIDHATGVVIGETTVIGDRVKLYQGVTLGAASVSKARADTQRHPTMGDDVVVYANATILGGDTVVGARSVIGGNVWLTHGVPPDSVVTHEGLTTRVRSRGTEPPLEFHI